MSLKIFNTASRKLEDFSPIHPGKVSLYTCGPTVYNYAHLGNLRTYVFEDVLRRTLERAGYEVNHVMNITDVGHLQSDADAGDDKMQLAAEREKRSPWDIARAYEVEFFKHSGMLNIKRPTTVCRATEHIPQMIEMTQSLIDKGYAYENKGNVYFDVSKFDRYADFAQLKMESQASTGRIEYDDKKRNQTDFALWFSESKFPNQIMKWPSPWGIGSPGWHIECSAMATRYLGDKIDIHCGGIDHIPVHHTNEIAQSECHHGHKWVNYWMHGEFLNDDSGKMSKSKDDFLTLNTIVDQGYDPLDYRYLLLTAHYRGQLKFSFDALSSARTARLGLMERLEDWKKADPATAENANRTEEYRQKFLTSAFTDLHLPKALATVWEIAKASDISPAEKLSLVRDFDSILGLGLTKEQIAALNEEQAKLLEERTRAREAMDWAKSDHLRDQLLEKGVKVKDTKKGTEWTFV